MLKFWILKTVHLYSEIKTYFIVGRKTKDGIVESLEASKETEVAKPDNLAVNIDGEAGGALSTESDTLMNETSASQVINTYMDHVDS